MQQFQAQTAPGADSKIVVGVGDMAVSADPSKLLITYALGSCIGVTVYDPVAQVGGLLHFMLPSSKNNPEKAQQKPAMFGDVGVPMLFKECYALGAEKSRMIVCAAGGAEILDDDGHFKIGSRNRTVLRKLFWKNDVLMAADETGGSISRTLSVCVNSGEVLVRHRRETRALWQTD